jgi:hypothetical protein
VAKSDRTDRRAVADRVRSQRERTERLRAYSIVGVCLVIGLAIVGAAAYRPLKNAWDTRAFASVPVADIGSEAAVCGEVETEPAQGNQEHREEGTEIEYDAAPPAFGPHWNVWEGMDKKFYGTGDRPPLQRLVHNLEHGFTILWYDETVAEDDEMLGQVRRIAEKYAGTDNLRLKFMAVPWTSEDGDAFPDGQHVALTHWSNGGVGDEATGEQVGVWQYCSAPSGEAVQQFMSDYPYMDSPEPGAV